MNTRLNDVGFIGIQNNRSRAYLQRLAQSGFRFSYAIILTDPQRKVVAGQQQHDVSTGNASCIGSPILPDDPFVIDESRSLIETLKAVGTNYSLVDSVDMNDDLVIEALSLRPEGVWCFSGSGGNILRRPVLSLGKRFLHMHPGAVPEFRGSTTFYYSLIESGSCAVSAIFLSSGVDMGDLVLIRHFPPPTDMSRIDYHYDPVIRSATLLSVIEDYDRTGAFSVKPQQNEGKTWYTIHPLLKHLAVLELGPNIQLDPSPDVNG